MSQNNKIPDFKKMAAEILADVPRDVAEKARAFFLMSFIKQGFTDFSFIAWPKHNSDASHKLLQQSLALKNSIRIEQATMKLIAISAGKGLPYAAIHNTGGTINVTLTDKMRRFFWAMHYKTGDNKWKYMALTKKKNLMIRIPKRQYIGESAELMKRIDQHMAKTLLEKSKQLKFK